MFDVELREIGEQDWLPFLERPADKTYAEWIQLRLTKNYPRIESRVVAWDSPCAHRRGTQK